MKTLTSDRKTVVGLLAAWANRNGMPAFAGMTQKDVALKNYQRMGEAAMLGSVGKGTKHFVMPAKAGIPFGYVQRGAA